MTCKYQVPSPKPLQLKKYASLHPDGKRLIDQWFLRALSSAEEADESPFEAFIFLWIAFNGFASCVTGKDRDAEMLRRMGNCPEFRARFQSLLLSESDFAKVAGEFAALWPIFKVQDIRRNRLGWPTLSSRLELIQQYFSVPNINHEPDCYRFHTGQGDSVPVDWPHTIHAIYRVRCNLFHGEKAPHSEMDKRIVTSAFGVLAMFLERAEVISPSQRLKRAH